ncbi:unnamed protein product [Moneuplotes crassus]|uniref:Uncharacterized protein n=1 Tax=Euplotes crassus TaxID=5936 RepID=A0AAD1XEP4_EUPCR|nr:unnamed protein product [Moneuplotes crassus]|eukprot:CAMPEP_0197007412 /NCGR_PEP_ID=MMETSP1380-20130617/40466_1 /TAXON_ID=5936 /ORGANISM="Euplotes crassus, Strain CT5" /LENGTH=175 /DNA_ID=CAMNT_0042427479 /DNA_START=301 /DNA_END=828 /DNA_ORIENTATION=+
MQKFLRKNNLMRNKEEQLLKSPQPVRSKHRMFGPSSMSKLSQQLKPTWTPVKSYSSKKLKEMEDLSYSTLDGWKKKQQQSLSKSNMIENNLAIEVSPSGPNISIEDISLSPPKKRGRLHEIYSTEHFSASPVQEKSNQEKMHLFREFSDQKVKLKKQIEYNEELRKYIEIIRNIN